MVEPTDPDHAALSWLQLQDSALPSGRFVHSYGLEAWLAAFPAAGEAEVATLAGRFVAGSVATLDAVVLAHTADADHTELVRLDRLLLSYKTAASARSSSQTGGQRLARLAIDAFDGLDASPYLAEVAAGAVPGNLAVVEGHVHAELGVPVRNAVLGHLRAAYAGFLSAGVRLGRLGPVAVQRLVHRHRAALSELAGLAASRSLDDLGSSVPELDLYAMTHETRTARLFAT
ncbi:urease accessory protein UreF [Actinomycetospora sp. NBC_00405]|uniref:urease accessory protein UreF n=1 Tax=Actinomycetospora sp. NBC_00405 TaxID=2975952 RepID=UPI002E24FF2D